MVVWTVVQFLSEALREGGYAFFSDLCRARDLWGITEPNVIVPVSAHAAVNKAGHYFGIRIIIVPVNEFTGAPPHPTTFGIFMRENSFPNV